MKYTSLSGGVQNCYKKRRKMYFKLFIKDKRGLFGPTALCWKRTELFSSSHFLSRCNTVLAEPRRIHRGSFTTALKGPDLQCKSHSLFFRDTKTKQGRYQMKQFMESRTQHSLPAICLQEKIKQWKHRYRDPFPELSAAY